MSFPFFFVFLLPSAFLCPSFFLLPNFLTSSLPLAFLCPSFFPFSSLSHFLFSSVPFPPFLPPLCFPFSSRCSCFLPFASLLSSSSFPLLLAPLSLLRTFCNHFKLSPLRQKMLRHPSLSTFRLIKNSEVNKRVLHLRSSNTDSSLSESA